MTKEEFLEKVTKWAELVWDYYDGRRRKRRVR
jgi:hypothetical protein